MAGKRTLEATVVDVTEGFCPEAKSSEGLSLRTRLRADEFEKIIYCKTGGRNLRVTSGGVSCEGCEARKRKGL